MSVVTNLILTFATGEDEIACEKAINDYTYHGLKMNLVSVDFDKDQKAGKAWYGGGKFLEAALYIGAFNHFDIEDFRKYLRKLNWEFPELVQLIVKEQDDEKFRIIEL